MKIRSINLAETRIPAAVFNHCLFMPGTLALRTLSGAGLEVTALRRPFATPAIINKITEARAVLEDERGIFPDLPVVQYEGLKHTTWAAFGYYHPDLVVPSVEKSLKELMPFSISLDHFNTYGQVSFQDRQLEPVWHKFPEPLTQALIRIQAGFEFLAKLGIEYYSFDSWQLVPFIHPVFEPEAQLDLMTWVLRSLQDKTGIKLACLTRRFGPVDLGTFNQLALIQQLKKSIDMCLELGASRFIPWHCQPSYREFFGNLDENGQAELTAHLRELVEYARERKFFENGGRFLIESKTTKSGCRIIEDEFLPDLKAVLDFLNKFGLRDYFVFEDHPEFVGSSAGGFYRPQYQAFVDGLRLSTRQKCTDCGPGKSCSPEWQQRFFIGSALYHKQGLKSGVINLHAESEITSRSYLSGMFGAVISLIDQLALGIWAEHFKTIEPGILNKADERYRQMISECEPLWRTYDRKAGEVYAQGMEAVYKETVAALGPKIQKEAQAQLGI